MEFLQNSHDYFLKYGHAYAPDLASALEETHNDINPAIIAFFDSYLEEVRKHFAYEEKKYSLIHTRACMRRAYKLQHKRIQKHHDEVGEKLTELKNIILQFYTTSQPNKMYDVLVDLYNAEEDLESHSEIENHILIPSYCPERDYTRQHPAMKPLNILIVTSSQIIAGGLHATLQRMRTSLQATSAPPDPIKSPTT